jgi:phosphatidylserine decarboxylase
VADASLSGAPTELPLAPVIQQFQQLIEGDWKLFMLFHQIFDQIPKNAPFDKDPSGQPQVRRSRKF